MRSPAIAQQAKFLAQLLLLAATESQQYGKGLEEATAVLNANESKMQQFADFRVIAGTDDDFAWWRGTIFD
jgi:hypothetical protein